MDHKNSGVPSTRPYTVSAGDDGAALLEELCWLLRCCAHLVADPSGGEQPEVPLPMAEACEQAQAAGHASPLQALSEQLLSTACLAADGSHGLSSRCARSGPGLHIMSAAKRRSEVDWSLSRCLCLQAGGGCAVECHTLGSYLPAGWWSA